MPENIMQTGKLDDCQAQDACQHLLASKFQHFCQVLKFLLIDLGINVLDNFSLATGKADSSWTEL